MLRRQPILDRHDDRVDRPGVAVADVVPALHPARDEPAAVEEEDRRKHGGARGDGSVHPNLHRIAVRDGRRPIDVVDIRMWAAGELVETGQPGPRRPSGRLDVVGEPLGHRPEPLESGPQLGLHVLGDVHAMLLHS